MINDKDKHNHGRLDGQPNPIDVHVGHRIRLRRTLLGYSQQYLAQQLGLTFQQVQKYEKGLNRVGASRLFDISRVLRVSMNFFFDDMDESVRVLSPRMLNPACKDLAEEAETVEADPMDRRETIELVRAYYALPDRKIAKDLFNLIINLSKAGGKLFEDE